MSDDEKLAVREVAALLACVLKIREIGLEDYAAFMTDRKRQTLPRRRA